MYGDLTGEVSPTVEISIKDIQVSDRGLSGKPTIEGIPKRAVKPSQILK